MSAVDPHQMAVWSEMVIRAGRTLLESGASTSRVEETMFRIAKACGFDDVNVLANPTGIYITLGMGEVVTTRVANVAERGIDLGKVSFINDISRRLESGSIDPTEAASSLREIQTLQPVYRFRYTFLARGLSSGCWALLLGGTAPDFLPAMIAGFGMQAIFDRLHHYAPSFIAIFFGAMLGTGWAVLAVNMGWAVHLSAVVVGVIVPLAPGVALTSAVRDLIAGHLVSGVTRGAEALLVAVAIAAGVSTILSTVVWLR